jgi:hypothetical protein
MFRVYLWLIVQKIIASILLLAFIGQTFRQEIYFLDYLVEKAAYAKKCLNKARPAMHCEGKCQHISFLPLSFTDKARICLIRTIGSPIHHASSLFHPPGII